MLSRLAASSSAVTPFLDIAGFLDTAGLLDAGLRGAGLVDSLRAIKLFQKNSALYLSLDSANPTFDLLK